MDYQGKADKAGEKEREFIPIYIYKSKILVYPLSYPIVIWKKMQLFFKLFGDLKNMMYLCTWKQ